MARRDPGPVTAAALMAVLLALFFLPALTTSDQFLARDAGTLHHPMKRWVAERWARGELPAWNPYGGLGVPELGSAVDAVLHPFNLLLVALPYEAGFKAWVLLSFLAAALGAWAMARRLGCGWHASVAAGLTFSLSGHLVGSSDNLTYLTSLASLPWIFAAGLAFQARPGPASLAGVGLASALCAAGGDPQAWGFALLALGPAMLALPPTGGLSVRRRLALAGVAVGAALAASAPLWAPVLAWLPHSSRALAQDSLALSRWDLAPRRLLELVVPNLLRAPPGTVISHAQQAFMGGVKPGLPWVASIYFGATTLLLAGAGAVVSRPARTLLLAAITFTWMACGAHLGFAALASHLPVLWGFRYWEKLFIWPSLFTVMAAALGLDALLHAGPAARRRFAVAAGLAATALLLAWQAAGQWPLATARLLMPRPTMRAAEAAALVQNVIEGLGSSALAVTLLALVAAAALAPRLARITPALFLAALAVDPFSANGHAYGLGSPPLPGGRAPLAEAMRARPGLGRVYVPFDPIPNRWPTLGKKESIDRWAARSLRGAWNVQLGVGNFEPYSGMPPLELQRLFDTVTTPALTPRLGVWSISAISVPMRADLAAAAGLTPPFQVLASDDELPCYLVAMPHRPRAYLAEAVISTTAGQAQSAIMELPPASTRSVVEGPVPPGLAAPLGEVRFLEDRPERITLEAVTDRPSLLVLSDQHAPGWAATIDGRPAAILRANLLARGVWLEPGIHVVRFTYRTPGLLAGTILAAVLLALLGGWALVRRCRAAAAP